ALKFMVIVKTVKRKQVNQEKYFHCPFSLNRAMVCYTSWLYSRKKDNGSTFLSLCNRWIILFIHQSLDFISRSTAIHLRTLLINHMFVHFFNSSIRIVLSFTFPSRSKTSRNVPASRPLLTGGVNNSFPISTTRFPVVNSVTS